MSFLSLEELIETQNPVRFIDAFVDRPFLKRLVTKINEAQVHKHLGYGKVYASSNKKDPKPIN